MNNIVHQIEIRAKGEDREVLAFNQERGKWLHVGTISGQTYEKGNASILHRPVPSFTLTKTEYTEVTQAGAEYLRLIPHDKSATYCLSLARFYQVAEPYSNAWYGDQLRVPLSKFERAATTRKRNKRTDNPARVTEQPDIIQQRRERQLGLFG
jgi:hypothetical protein